MNGLSKEFLQGYLIATNHTLDRLSDQVSALVETLKEHSPELYAKYQSHRDSAEKHRLEALTEKPEQFLEAERQLIDLVRKLGSNLKA